jgi:hypothetical protein
MGAANRFGPASGSTWSQPATQVDMAPTFLGLAGLPKPPQMDGKSLVPLLMPATFAEAAVVKTDTATATATGGVARSTADHFAALLAPLGTAGAVGYAAKWRKAAFVEYYFVEANIKCMGNCHPPVGQGKGYPYVIYFR